MTCFAGLVLATLLTSCAAKNLPPLDPSHPASPEADESTPAEPAPFLGRLGGAIGGEEASRPEMHGAGGAGHGH